MSQQAIPVNEFSENRLGVFGKLFGLVLFVVVLLLPNPEGLHPSAQRLAAVTLLMAVLWVTQAIPIAATSMIPLVAFPLLGIQTSADVSRSYMNQNVFLFLGGFIIALGIERWGLHRRMALHIVRILGSSPRRVLCGFMLATAFLSMWISNTASTLLMLPIALALLRSFSEFRRTETGASETVATQTTGQDSLSHGVSSDRSEAQLAIALMLGIAYSASIGGFMTLVGTPTNVAFQQIWRDQFPNAPELSAGEWITACFPLGVAYLIAAWGILGWKLAPISGFETLGRGFFTRRLQELGKPNRPELLMLMVFATTALLWILRVPLRIGDEPLLPGWGDWVEQWLLAWGTEPEIAAQAVHDSTVAMGMALLMFFIPADRDESGRTRYLMNWKTAERLPWGILLLFGGGFAIADGFRITELSAWMGDRFAIAVSDASPLLLVLVACLLMTFLTEFTSNVATVMTLLPILAGASVGLDIDPRLLMFPTTIAASCAFMLPIATPPNAIVFGSGKVRISDMVRQGVALNLLGTVLITAATFWWLVPQFQISLNGAPDWCHPESKAVEHSEESAFSVQNGDVPIADRSTSPAIP